MAAPRATTEHQIDLSDADAWDDTALIAAYDRAIRMYQVRKNVSSHAAVLPSCYDYSCCVCAQDNHGNGSQSARTTAANGRGKQYARILNEFNYFCDSN